VQVGDHKDIGDAVDEWQKGWRLHAYACAGARMPVVHHYLLFEKGERDKNKDLVVCDDASWGASPGQSLLLMQTRSGYEA
jgi:hypothetical protein